MIAGDRVTLRAWSRADLPTFHKCLNDPGVTVWAGNPYLSLSLEKLLPQPEEVEHLSVCHSKLREW